MESGMTSEIANCDYLFYAYSLMLTGRILWTLFVIKNMAPVHPRGK